MNIARTRQGFSLVEITVAIGIAAFCFLVIFALLPTGLNTNQSSIQQTIAGGLVSGIVADLRAVSPTVGGNSPLYALDPSTSGTTTLYLKEDGSKEDAPANADYAAKVKITPQNIGDIVVLTHVHIAISSPANAPQPRNSFEYVTDIDRTP